MSQEYPSRNQYQEQRLTKPKDDFLANMIRNGINKQFIDSADQCGNYLAKEAKLTTSQIRRIFGHVKKIESYDDPKRFLPQLLMLKPLLAYQKKRNSPVQYIEPVLRKGIDAVEEAKNDEKELLNRFRLFCKGFEAILAYHRAHGGN